MKVSWETKKIFDNDEIKVSCTAVRVPTFRAHAESIIVKTKEDVDIDELKSGEIGFIITGIKNEKYIYNRSWALRTNNW